uniref:Ribonucleoprotein, chloroplastic n=1 Tax=Anthurium amnicola TaxID=1678845 RepID=A0A1D1Y4N5_9ARAE
MWRNSAVRGRLAMGVVDTLRNCDGLLRAWSISKRTRGFSTEIFVSRLSSYTTEGDFKAVFSSFGDIEEVFGYDGCVFDIRFDSDTGMLFCVRHWFQHSCFSFSRLIRDKRTNRPKGFGSGQYRSEVEAQRAMKAMDGRILAGRLIFVEIAKPRPEERDSS